MNTLCGPKPGGAVTGSVLLLAGRCPEPTQRGHGGGQDNNKNKNNINNNNNSNIDNNQSKLH